jgi:hypothetical protein
MKQLFNGVKRHNGHSIASSKGTRYSVTVFSVLFISIIFSSCKKQEAISKSDDSQSMTAQKTSEENVVNNYAGLNGLTIWQLQQARAATARYRNIDNAIKDGYTDIEVDVQHMGHHYMNTSLIDSVFDFRQPEILVYNRDDKGKQQLVAVEYAVPLTYPRPEGFSGSSDVWKDDSGFPLWLLHAWVWAYNPDGVFNWTNPLIELQ